MGEVIDHVAVSVERPVGIVRLERPEKLNAITYPMIAAIRAGVDALALDPAVAGIVITGSGRGFCAGLDLDALTRTAGGEVRATAEPTGDPKELPALFSYLLRVPKPVIAAVNGVAAGGGFVLAMMCDLRFAARSARFTTSFSKRGLIAEHGTSWLLPRLVGTSRALDLLWSSRVMEADEAERIGFVDRLLPDDCLVDEACEYVRALAATASPRSMARMKALVLRGWSAPIDVALHEVNDEMQEALDHPDATEGVRSFVERRPPQFQPWTGGLL
jgi:enoyl-CoA hydratase/carnithine racemase